MRVNTRSLVLLAASIPMLGGVFSTVHIAAAQAIDEPPLSLEDAVERALTENPELRAAGLAIEIERMRRDQASLPPPLALDTEIENFAGSDSSAGLTGAEITLGVSRVIERGGKAALRREIGERRMEQAATAAETARLALAERVTQRFIDVLALQERVTLAQQAVEIASETLAIVGARVDVGRSLEAERATATVALARAELARSGVERQLETARMSLASLWGAETPDFPRAGGNLYTLPRIESFEALSMQLDDNPDLLRRGAELRRYEAERRLAASRQQPDLSISGGLRHLGQQDDLGLVLSVSVPFGTRSRAQPEIDAADLLLEQSPLATAAQRRQLRAQLFALHQELTFARTALAALRETIIPEAENAVSMYGEAFAVGSSTLLELVDAQNRLLALRGEALEAASSYHSDLAEVRYLLGRR